MGTGSSVDNTLHKNYKAGSVKCRKALVELRNVIVGAAVYLKVIAKHSSSVAGFFDIFSDNSVWVCEYHNQFQDQWSTIH